VNWKQLIGCVAAVGLSACGGGPDGTGGPGPWPTEAQKDYSASYHVGLVQSVAVDDAYNLWLLDGDRIGVLRPNDSQPRWAIGLGQAARGFPSTVICGGSAGRAYVGYRTKDLDEPWNATDADKAMGDADVVEVKPDGSIALVQHLEIHNSNDHHYDETRSILACAKVMRGPNKGDLFLGTNHAVTRIRGLAYSDHRHPVFRYPDSDKGSLHVGYNWAVSVTQDGDVFLGNEWKIGLATPTERLEEWIDFDRTPWKLDTYVDALGAQIDMDHWRATAQTIDRRYYLGSDGKGLWEVQLSPRRYTKVAGVPSEAITALAATEDGALFVGTKNAGLHLVTKDKAVQAFAGVPGSEVKQLLYDPTVSPPALFVLTNAGLTVLRGR
jgi:hypothetical protein